MQSSGAIASRAARGLPLCAFLALFGGDALRNSLGWADWASICVVVTVWSAAVVVRRGRDHLRHLPLPLVLFLAMMAASVSWSAYRGGTLLGLSTQFATTLAPLSLVAVASWPAIVRALGRSLRVVVLGSLAFELVVATLIRRPVCPVYVDCTGSPPAAFYWSRNALLAGGPIQGLPGNSNLLAVFGLLALVITVVERSAGRISWPEALVGLLGGAAALIATRSATVAICGVAVTAVAGVVLLVRRSPRLSRPLLVTGGAAALAGGALGATVASPAILDILGRQADLTGRHQIWRSVVSLIQERPILGWGWTGWWQPWLEPFADLATIRGVTYLQAHDAYLDVWLQLGVPGLGVFLALLTVTAVRAWAMATRGPSMSIDAAQTTSRLDALPLLILAILVVHGITESRINVEWGWALLVLVCLEGTRDRSGAFALTR